MIFFSSFALVAFIALLPSIYGRWNDQGTEVIRRNNSHFQLFGKVVMYVFAIFTQHGNQTKCDWLFFTVFFFKLVFILIYRDWSKSYWYIEPIFSSFNAWSLAFDDDDTV